ncbi:MAG: HAD family hydrolase [Rhodospirillum sp.]|nr:HAD family hydrolase [Rhodospirillum sp.]MCF8489097.1 HAD family hydrolase [Rhodospirillum sp.]MCF8498887.1 HAD family hydrolase [Rhodospirillum sp.]
MLANLQSVIFDVDGTLYSQPMLRRRMLVELLKGLASRRLKVKDVTLIRRYRQLRESWAVGGAEDLRGREYEILAEEIGRPVQQVDAIIKEWIYRRPLPHLLPCAFPGVADLFQALRDRGIQIGIFSDYPAEAKLASLGLVADVIRHSLEPSINRLKPHPLGLQTIIDSMGVSPNNCLFVGDRKERDGACAQAARVPYLQCNGGNFYITFLKELTSKIS